MLEVLERPFHPGRLDSDEEDADMGSETDEEPTENGVPEAEQEASSDDEAAGSSSGEEEGDEEADGEEAGSSEEEDDEGMELGQAAVHVSLGSRVEGSTGWGRR